MRRAIPLVSSANQALAKRKEEERALKTAVEVAAESQYDSHLGDEALSPSRASWNMHDMLMHLVPNLIIQFHGSLRQPPP